MSNRENFRCFLMKKDIYFEDVPFESGGHGYRLTQSIGNGPRLVLGVSFNKRRFNC